MEKESTSRIRYFVHRLSFLGLALEKSKPRICEEANQHLEFYLDRPITRVRFLSADLACDSRRSMFYFSRQFEAIAIGCQLEISQTIQ